MELPKRKSTRLKNYNYSENGAYFITICVKDRKRILCDIVGTGGPDHPHSSSTVGTGVPDHPQTRLLRHGEIVDKYINQLSQFYDNISVNKYVIMPDHIHLLISIRNGQSRRPVPTRENIKIDNTNSVIAQFVSTFKRFCNKEIGRNIWQKSFYDHIVRNQDDYNEKCEYIENNPTKWLAINETQGN